MKHYNFPETTFSQVNTFAEQMEHIRSEAKEITGAKIDSDYELDEATDLVHSWETLRRIDPARVQASVERVKQKNAARGYYVDGQDENGGCGGECGCSSAETLQILPIYADNLLHRAAETLVDRGQQYDSPQGERSAAKTAAAWEIITGKSMTAAEAWLFLQILKDVRQWQKPGHYDSALDCVAYAALKGEELMRGEGK